jgi:hypothetical protein
MHKRPNPSARFLLRMKQINFLSAHPNTCDAQTANRPPPFCQNRLPQCHLFFPEMASIHWLPSSFSISPSSKWIVSRNSNHWRSHQRSVIASSDLPPTCSAPIKGASQPWKSPTSAQRKMAAQPQSSRFHNWFEGIDGEAMISRFGRGDWWRRQ